MPNRRVYELAKDLGYDRQELVTKINDLGLSFSVANFMTKLTDDEISELQGALETAEAVEETAADGPEEAEAAAVTAAPVVRRRKGKASQQDESSDGEEAAGIDGVRVRRRKVSRSTLQEDIEAQVASAPAAEIESAAAEEAEVVEEPESVDVAEVESSAGPAEAEVEAQQVAEVEDTVEAAEVDEQDASAAVEDDVEAVVEAPAETDEVAEESTEAEVEAVAAEEEAPEAVVAPPQPASSEGKRRKSRSGAKKGGAQVLGQIDTSVVLDRLSAEGKDFSPGPSRKRRSKSKSSRKGRTKRVVEGRDLYGSKQRRKKRRSRNRKAPQKTQITEAAEHKRVIRIEDVISVGDLAHEMGVKAGEVAMKLVEMGMMATVNTLLDFETAQLTSDEFGYTVENVAFDISNFYDTSPDPDDSLLPRPPVVTVMGHVDHGKTSLLDAIRASDVTGGEAGGITQHIGAYTVDTGEQRVTFVDTPGHEAFTELRARGAKVTDIVVLVIAADDGVMPQTVEAINHARDAGVPIIVAINKVDKPTANADRIRQALTEYQLVPEEWGGTTLFAEVSALERINIDGLIEMIALQAELEELTANPDRDAQGVIIEAELDVGRGPVATALVQRGTLRQGDIIVSGQHYGRVRTMHGNQGKALETAGPSVPVEITGLSGIPEAGEPFFVVEDERDAKRITENVAEQRRKEVMASRAKEVTGSLEDLSKMIRQGQMKELKTVIKGDVQGSVEALKEAFSKVGNDEVRVKVIHAAVGGITESDINLAASSETGAIIVGFNVRPDTRATEVAEKYGVKVVTHNVIYDAIDQIRQVLEGLLSPIVEERVIGKAEVRETFSAPKIGTIAGCYVTNGFVRRNAPARVIRNGVVIYESSVNSLRRFKDDVTEVKDGFECGLSITNFNDIKVGDVVEAYEHQEVAATL